MDIAANHQKVAKTTKWIEIQAPGWSYGSFPRFGGDIVRAFLFNVIGRRQCQAA